MPVFEAGKLRLVTENQSICPEVQVAIYNGHTVGQLVGYIHFGERTLVYVGDVIPLVANVPLSWISSYDVFPLTAMEEKKTLLDEAAVKTKSFSSSMTLILNAAQWKNNITNIK